MKGYYVSFFLAFAFCAAVSCGKTEPAKPSFSYDALITYEKGNFSALAKQYPHRPLADALKDAAIPLTALPTTLEPIVRAPITLAGREAELLLFNDGSFVDQVSIVLQTNIDDETFFTAAESIIVDIEQKGKTPYFSPVQEADDGRRLIKTVAFQDFRNILRVEYGIVGSNDYFVAIALSPVATRN